jgi:import inner membrane translocase subunit TIM13
MSVNTQKIDPNQRQQIMASVQQQLALQNAQELLQKLSDKCFKACVQKPGSSLSSSEQVR